MGLTLFGAYMVFYINRTLVQTQEKTCMRIDLVFKKVIWLGKNKEEKKNSILFSCVATMHGNQSGITFSFSFPPNLRRIPMKSWKFIFVCFIRNDIEVACLFTISYLGNRLGI